MGRTQTVCSSVKSSKYGLLGTGIPLLRPHLLVRGLSWRCLFSLSLHTPFPRLPGISFTDIEAIFIGPLLLWQSCALKPAWLEDTSVSINLLTAPLSVVCTASAPGAGELWGSVVGLVIRWAERAFKFKTPQWEAEMVRGVGGHGSTEAKAW